MSSVVVDERRDGERDGGRGRGGGGLYLSWS